ncbi:ig-like domain-containing protein [Trichonephila clavipes]|nr:ig-like domain-containing protein [Trichonephila clavipes]
MPAMIRYPDHWATAALYKHGAEDICRSLKVSFTTCYRGGLDSPRLEFEVFMRLTKSDKTRVPPKVSVPKGQLAIRKGEAARLVCDVTGNGPINVKWVKKQSVIEIHPGSRYVTILPPTLIHYSPLSLFAEGKVFQLFEEGSLKM